jgi:hypothetical protein
VLQGKKLPEHFRKRLTFANLADDAVSHAEAHNATAGVYDFKCKVEVLKPLFGSRAADEITRKAARVASRDAEPMASGVLFDLSRRDG